MTEQADFPANRPNYTPKEEETASLSQPSTQEGSHKASFDGVQDWPTIAPKALLREMTFPTGKLSQQYSKCAQKAQFACFRPLSECASSRALANVAHLREVFETLEEELEPVDLRTRKALQRPAIVIGFPTASTLLRTRKLR